MSHIWHRYFIACEEEATADPLAEREMRENHEEYKSKLCVHRMVLPDAFTLEDGWTGEENMDVWSCLYFIDIANYLWVRIPSEQQEKLSCEYKQAKWYRYSYPWFQEIFFKTKTWADWESDPNKMQVISFRYNLTCGHHRLK